MRWLRCAGCAALSLTLLVEAQPDASHLDHGVRLRPRAAGLLAEAQPDASDWNHGVRLRPHAAGKPDVVEFGMLVKTFFGADIKGSSFFVDLVITSRWQDERAELVVPENLNRVAMGTEGAGKLIWMPDITVANRDLKGIETISSATIISAQGQVERVERVLVRLKTTFDITAFPFDTQDLPVRIVSTSFMADSLRLVPIEDPAILDMTEVEAVNGVDSSSFAGSEFKLEGFSLRSFEDVDGALVKSRGELLITVSRNSETYIETIFFPAFLLLALSWTSFFFPLLPAFAMPRAATTTIAFLALVTLGTRVDAMLPTKATLCWADIFIEVCELLMFGSIVFNITEQYIYNHLGDHTLANKMGHELMCLFPILTSAAMYLCFSACDGANLERTRLQEHLLLVVGIGAYIGVAFVRYCKETAKEVQVEDEAPKASTPPAALREPGAGSLSPKGLQGRSGFWRG